MMYSPTEPGWDTFGPAPTCAGIVTACLLERKVDEPFYRERAEGRTAAPRE
jgi:hypothetical protein